MASGDERGAAAPDPEVRRDRREDRDRQEHRASRDKLADLWEQRLALPVIIAAAVSVPAVFLTMLEDRRLELTGHALNWASLVVLVGEAVLLLVLCGHKRAWLWRHKWTLAVTAVAVPAVVYAVAPAQALRLLTLLKLVGTLRILRANTIVNAGRVLARRFGLTGPGRWALVVGGSVLAAAFVALVLVDPTAAREHQQLLHELQRWLGPVPALVAGLVLAAATFIVVLYRRGVPAEEPGVPAEEPAVPAEGPQPAGETPDTKTKPADEE